jgi:hypothetical protein
MQARLQAQAAHHIAAGLAPPPAASSHPPVAQPISAARDSPAAGYSQLEQETCQGQGQQLELGQGQGQGQGQAPQQGPESGVAAAAASPRPARQPLQLGAIQHALSQERQDAELRQMAAELEELLEALPSERARGLLGWPRAARAAWLAAAAAPAATASGAPGERLASLAWHPLPRPQRDRAPARQSPPPRSTPSPHASGAGPARQPSEAEVAAYAEYLGFDLGEGPGGLLAQEARALAQEALMAPLPPGWTAHLDGGGAEYFCELGSGRTSYEHPLDARYRAEYARLARALAGGGGGRGGA